MAHQGTYVLLTEALPKADRARLLQQVMRLVGARAHTFETDIPVGAEDQWPAPVRQAAEHLVRAGGQRQDDRGAYARTGVLHRSGGDEATWAAFVAFAGYAWDATVWDHRGRAVVSLADEGTSAVFRLTEAQAEQVAAVAPAAEVVPLRVWRDGQRWWRRRRPPGSSPDPVRDWRPRLVDTAEPPPASGWGTAARPR